MDRLVSRIRRSGNLSTLSDTLLLSLLANSDCVPEKVSNGVLLFQEDDQISYWYLLLNGEVQLYKTSNKDVDGRVFETLCPITLFGELSVPRHTCSALVTRNSELVTINQSHFIAIYNKHADHLQPYIVIMQDLSDAYDGQHVYDFTDMRQRCAELGDHSRAERYHLIDEEGTVDANVYPDWDSPSSLYEISSPAGLESRVAEVAIIIKQTMQLRAPELIKDRKLHMQTYPMCMIGTEMVDWLKRLSLEVLNEMATTFTRFQIVGIWQVLLENGFISHVNNELQFADKHIYYRWMIDIDLNAYKLRNGTFRDMSTYMSSPPTLTDIKSAVFFLSTVGPDALFRMILSKPSFERTVDELDLVYEELLHVKALAHLSTMVKKELASVAFFEQHQHAGTILFRQGDEGNCWYIILKGSVDVSIHGKGIVCSLREGDDFGKLALVNDAPRAATITLRERSQFLRVDKNDFNRILRDVEANTVRLKEYEEDVLVLEKINPECVKSFSDTDAEGSLPKRYQFCYSIMAGLPEKIVEYLLETRIDALEEDSILDPFLEDFFLTHTIYMPENILCNYLKNYYFGGSTAKIDRIYGIDGHEHKIIAKRRVIIFLGLWIRTLGIRFFLDPVSNSFVEELYCCVLEDSRQIPEMLPILEKISSLQQIREIAMQTLNRHSAVVLDCGVYCDSAPAPNPVLSFDTCNQMIYLPDGSSFTVSIRLDKTAAEICEITRIHMHYGGSNDDLQLIEVKSNGERIIFSSTDISIPTMLSLNSRLYVAYSDDIESLNAGLHQNMQLQSYHSSILDFMSGFEIAQQLSVFHFQLFEATEEIELITQVFGRDQFPGRILSNLDLLMRRFNEIQHWTTTEILLAQSSSKKVSLLKTFIKIASYAKENRDLLSFFAITLGLSNIAVSRLTHLWDKLPSKVRRQYAEFEALLDPSRNHRAYRMLVKKMSSPTVPFVPLLLKDLAFTHEGNKTYFSTLVNFEKMHMIANILRCFRKSKYPVTSFDPRKIFDKKNLVRNFKVIDNQRKLMELSYKIEPSKRRT